MRIFRTVLWAVSPVVTVTVAVKQTSLQCSAEYSGLCALLQVLRRLPNVQSLAFQAAIQHPTPDEMLLATVFASLQLASKSIDFEELVSREWEGRTVGQSPENILQFMVDGMFPWLGLVLGGTERRVIRTIAVPSRSSRQVSGTVSEPLSIQTLLGGGTGRIELDARGPSPRLRKNTPFYHRLPTRLFERSNPEEDPLATVAQDPHSLNNIANAKEEKAKEQAKQREKAKEQAKQREKAKDQAKQEEELANDGKRPPEILALQFAAKAQHHLEEKSEEEIWGPVVKMNGVITFEGAKFVLVGVIVRPREHPEEYAAMVRPTWHGPNEERLTRISEWHLVNSAEHAFETQPMTFDELAKAHHAHLLFYAQHYETQRSKHRTIRFGGESPRTFEPHTLFREDAVPEVVKRHLARRLDDYTPIPVLPSPHRERSRNEQSEIEEEPRPDLESPPFFLQLSPKASNGPTRVVFPLPARPIASANDAKSPRQERSPSPFDLGRLTRRRKSDDLGSDQPKEKQRVSPRSLARILTPRQRKKSDERITPPPAATFSPPDPRQVPLRRDDVGCGTPEMRILRPRRAQDDTLHNSSSRSLSVRISRHSSVNNRKSDEWSPHTSRKPRRHSKERRSLEEFTSAAVSKSLSRIPPTTDGFSHVGTDDEWNCPSHPSAGPYDLIPQLRQKMPQSKSSKKPAGKTSRYSATKSE